MGTICCHKFNAVINRFVINSRSFFRNSAVCAPLITPDGRSCFNIVSDQRNQSRGISSFDVEQSHAFSLVGIVISDKVTFSHSEYPRPFNSSSIISKRIHIFVIIIM
ncbi:hypothetical protein RF11_14026 [Thelohanellus kitauei]|uniref:Uncharacterized protein n=1 Tax=Thelohanellus kitauei TaxID=669202 RepID=A0A0C2J6G3_THEKT|nr:hypothetical protein RF11_14026 [Thelohanellus kitauei]